MNIIDKTHFRSAPQAVLEYLRIAKEFSGGYGWRTAQTIAIQCYLDRRSVIAILRRFVLDGTVLRSPRNGGKALYSIRVL
jgi:hypothetical protein